jgi:hypothetical protein
MSKERLDMAAYLYSYHMDHGCAKEKDKLWGNETFREALLKKDSKSTHIITNHLVSRKDLNADSCSHFHQLQIPTFMKIEVKRMKMK